MSSKYATLKHLSKLAAVPPLLALGDDELRTLWINHDEVSAQAGAVLQSMHFTAGAFLDRDLARLEACPAPAWAANADEQLLSHLTSAGLAPKGSWAVRSSGGIEDGAAHSFAGVFDSVLDVQGLSALKDAIAQVWRSVFSRRAVIERLRCGLLLAPVEMGVIIQAMVRSRWAGVAFSHDPVSGRRELLVEAVPGLGDALVSGALRAFSARMGPAGVLGDGPLLAQPAMLAAVSELVQRVQGELGCAVDVEWAFDGEQLWLLQSRPITSLHAPVAADACCEWALLYLATDEVLATFRPMPDFAQYFRTKRRPLALLAQEQGVSGGTAVVVRANAKGYADEAAAGMLLSMFRGHRVVLDFSDGVRQQVVPTADLRARLAELLSPQVTTFVIREFIQGELGLITQPLGGDGAEVLCECSPDGLLALNRGSAVTRAFYVDPSGRVTADDAAAAGFSAAQLRQMHRVTQMAVGRFGQVQLEWVLDAGELRLIDFSEVQQLHSIGGADGQRTISPGYARGKPLLIADDRALEDISIAATVSINHLPDAESLGPMIIRLLERARSSEQPLIVAAPRPYAALAALIPYVAGFVFEQSSLLCHLAILLRESQLPAVESTALYRQALAGSFLTLEARGEQASEVVA